MVERLFLAEPRGCLRLVILVFPDHTHLLFLYKWLNSIKLMYLTLCFGIALHGRTPFLHGMILSINISWFVVHIKDSPGEKVSEYD